jgi:hypothetical protein
MKQKLKAQSSKLKRNPKIKYPSSNIRPKRSLFGISDVELLLSFEL